MLFNSEWHRYFVMLIIQLRPCVPSSWTSAPQRHVWLWHILPPKRRPMQILIVFPSSNVPLFEIGIECNHWPDSVACSAVKRAMSFKESKCRSSRTILSMFSKSQFFCDSGLVGSSVAFKDCQTVKPSSIWWIEISLPDEWRMLATRNLAPNAEARKAGILISWARRMPIPPRLMGSEAWIHCLSSRCKLKMFSRHCRISMSKVLKKSGNFQEAQVLRK